MTPQDREDFLAHPEWFETVAIRSTTPALRAALPLMTKEKRRAVIDNLVNSLILIRRKPVPFVLPIKGSAL